MGFKFVSGEVIRCLKREGLVDAFWEIDGTGFGCGERVGWSGNAEVSRGSDCQRTEDVLKGMGPLDVFGGTPPSGPI
jgi:hypothetical protein